MNVKRVAEESVDSGENASYRTLGGVRGRGGAHVSTQLPRHGRLVAPDRLCDLRDALALAPHHHDVLALLYCKMLVVAHAAPFSNDVVANTILPRAAGPLLMLCVAFALKIQGTKKGIQRRHLYSLVPLRPFQREQPVRLLPVRQSL